MTIENETQLQGVREIGSIVANCLAFMKSSVRVGMSTAELDELGEKYLIDQGARSAPRTVYNFPGATCISVEHEGVHGIPGAKTIEEGYLINIDVSAEKAGYFADTGGSFVVGQAIDLKHRLCTVTKAAREVALRQVSSGRPINALGKSVQDYVESKGMSVIRNVGGHGVGLSLHEEPDFIANYYEKKDRRKFKKNSVVAIEPIISTGAQLLEDAGDGWTLYHPIHYTAQFEHTVMVTDGEPLIFTQPTKDFD